MKRKAKDLQNLQQQYGHYDIAGYDTESADEDEDDEEQEEDDDEHGEGDGGDIDGDDNYEYSGGAPYAQAYAAML